MEVTLRQLELFAALPNFSTLGETAAHMHISESALSQAITSLERTVGEQLCVRRRSRGLTLTPTGQEFAKRARRIVSDARELVFDARGRDLRGPVALGCFNSFATNVIPDLMQGFPLRHPAVDLDVTIGTTDELFAALDAGRLDVALVYDVALPIGFRKRSIYPTELEVHLHPDHPLAARAEVDLVDLADEPMIHYDATPGSINNTDAFLARGLEPNIVARVTQISLVEALVSRGMGYGLLMSRPNPRLSDEFGPAIVTRRLNPTITATSVVGIWPHDAVLTARAEALLDYAIEVLGTGGCQERERRSASRDLGG